jgi:tRNA G18 (ribose-2'-O)-methylase SpoU
VLSPRCADPFYRKAIRVSMGAVLRLPVVRLGAWPEDLERLKRRHRLTLLGAVVGDGAAAPLGTVARPARVALLLGAEGPGLSAAARAACDRLITIPMAAGAGADSLNVATAGAIALYQLLHAAPPERDPPRP